MPRESGITLLETLIAAVLLGIAMTIVAMTIQTTLASTRHWTDGHDVLQNSEMAMTNFPEELGMLPQIQIASAVTIAMPDRIRYKLPDGKEREFYRNSDGELIRLDVSTGAVETVARRLETLRFRYYGIDATSGQIVSTTDPNKITSVSVDATLHQGQRILQVQAVAMLRNS